MHAAQAALEEHLGSGRFRTGEAKGRWKLQQLTWPHVVIQLLALDGRAFDLRLDCSGYPDQPPTGTLWDSGAARMLPADRWPRGGRVSQVFNPAWKGGAALYLPCDRESIAGHPNWHSEYSWLIWNPARGLVQYLEAVYEVLQSRELISQGA